MLIFAGTCTNLRSRRAVHKQLVARWVSLACGGHSPTGVRQQAWELIFLVCPSFLPACLPFIAQTLRRRVHLLLRRNTLTGTCPDLGSSLGAGADSKAQVLQEQYALTEVIHGKNKSVSAAQWHPQRKVHTFVLTAPCNNLPHYQA